MAAKQQNQPVAAVAAVDIELAAFTVGAAIGSLLTRLHHLATQPWRARR